MYTSKAERRKPCDQRDRPDDVEGEVAGPENGRARALQALLVGRAVANTAA